MNKIRSLDQMADSKLIGNLDKKIIIEATS